LHYLRYALAATIALAATATTAAAQSPPVRDVPILYNDHHVRANPNVLQDNRVLAALEQGDQIFVPLRAMFEQMGATVAYDPATQTTTITKPGSEVKVTVGRPEIVINGEVRPLDVPPEIYQGVVVVPLRALSEAMGAYVLWIQDRNEVVVRYLPQPVATMAPTMAPTMMPTPVPTMRPTRAPAMAPPTMTPTMAPTPTPAPTPIADEHFIVGDYLVSPQTYNAYSSNSHGTASWAGRAAFELPILGLPLMIEGDARQYSFNHPAGFVTNIGGQTATFVPGFTGYDRDSDVRLGLKVFSPRVYVGVGYMWQTNDYGNAHETGIGYGLEKLPDLQRPFSFYGSAWYYPSVRGNYTDPVTGFGWTPAYQVVKYDVGVDAKIAGPLFLDLGFLGERGNQRIDAPSSFIHSGAAVGIGIHF
jgi:hypothetical protein